jgi:A/G-specific adenine glycosylase
MLSTRKFRKIVWDFYTQHGRHTLPWRLTRDPYKILVSEIMLQQTQVERVIPYYARFLNKFPTVEKLAKAKRPELLTAWQGLGYNRRAINLQRTAQVIVQKYKGKFPTIYSELVELPGVGPATAGDLLAFAYNKPAVVLETNIRHVFFHHYFSHMKERHGQACKIYDKEVAPLVAKTLDRENPREWYYALMDYGSHLKRGDRVQSRTLHRMSAHYTKQSKFQGSNRELRSQILKLMLERPRTEKEILKLLDAPAPAIKRNLLAMRKEGLI